MNKLVPATSLCGRSRNQELTITITTTIAEMLEMSLINLFPNISIALRIFFSLLFPCQLLRQNAHLGPSIKYVMLFLINFDPL